MTIATAVLLVLLWPLVLCGLVYLAVDADLTKPIRDAFVKADAMCAAAKITGWRARFVHFVAKLSSCPKCSAGWLSAPAALAVSACSWIPDPWVWVYGLLLVAPPAGIGLVVILTMHSPASAVGIAFKEMDKRRGTDG
jgi:hypothetical protein